MSIIAFPLSATTVYLLPCHDGYLQIDTGYPWDYPRYRRLLSRQGIGIQEVRRLLLTHHHDDHAGFLNDLARDVAELTIITHDQGRDLLRGGRNDRSRGGGYVSRRIAFLAGLRQRIDRRWTLTFPPFELRAGDVTVCEDAPSLLRDVGIDGVIVTTPGHCVDHLAVVLDTGEAFCGDAAARMMLWAGTRYCTVFNTDMDQVYESWQKLLASGAKTIYPAHGTPFPASRLRVNMGRIKRLCPMTA